jgi:hypothetical protein
MSAVSTITPAAADRDAGIPFGRLVRTELRKLYDTRASRWLLIAIAAITPIVMVVLVFALSRRTSPSTNWSTSPRHRRRCCCRRWGSWP